MFDHYSQNEINAGEYDPLSIMHYFFPSDWFKDPNDPRNPTLQVNQTLSQGDRRLLLQKYPVEGVTVPDAPPAPEEPQIDWSNATFTYQDGEPIEPFVVSVTSAGVDHEYLITENDIRTLVQESDSSPTKPKCSSGGLSDGALAAIIIASVLVVGLLVYTLIKCGSANKMLY